MKKIVGFSAALLMMIAGVVLVFSSSSQATVKWPGWGNCHPKSLQCGSIEHYSPDVGVDKPIRIRCNPSGNALVAEGESSTKSCVDTDMVRVRVGQEIWCKYEAFHRYIYWSKQFDRTGWHKIDGTWDDGFGCVIRKDNGDQ